MNNSSIFKTIKKADLVLAAILLAASFAGFLFLRPGKAGGGSVVVRVRGEIVAEYPLNEDREVIIPENAAAGSDYNELVIENGEVFVRDANCSNHLCIMQGRISRPGQTIICLPHRMTAEIVGAETGKEVPDAVTY